MNQLIFILTFLSLNLIAVHCSGLNIDATDKNTCGRKILSSRRKKRIVNGEYASEGEFPWQAAVYVSDKFTCGGALVSNQWVITAAHCLVLTIKSNVTNFYFEYSQKAISIHLGQRILATTNDGLEREVRNVSQYYIHPQYDKANLFLGYDIALIQLSEEVDFHAHIQPICLPKKSEIDVVGRVAQVSGWGHIAYDVEEPERPQTLRKISLPVIENSICVKFVKFYTEDLPFELDEKYICGVYKSGKTTLCHGDSGSPLQIQRYDGSWFVAGVHSFSLNNCGIVNDPSILTKISIYVPWIRRTIYWKSMQII